MDTGEYPTYESDTPQRVSLGEVWRGQQRLEKQFNEQFGGLNNKLDEIFKQNIPARVDNLEKWRDWSFRVVIGGIISALMIFLFATGGTVT